MNVPNDFRGKYVALGRAFTWRREAYVATDVAVVTKHMRAERAGENRTDHTWLSSRLKTSRSSTPRSGLWASSPTATFSRRSSCS
eukprot:5644996-Prymnesium_polylepis.1